MSLLNPVKDFFYIDNAFTRKNTLIITGIIAEISVIAFLILSQAPLAIICATLITTNLIKIALFAKKIKKKDDDLEKLLKIKQQRERDIEVLNLKISELEKKTLN